MKIVAILSIQFIVKLNVKGSHYKVTNDHPTKILFLAAPYLIEVSKKLFLTWFIVLRLFIAAEL